MNWENIAYAILGLLGIAIGFGMLIPALESNPQNETGIGVGGFLIFVGFFCLNTIKKEDKD